MLTLNEGSTMSQSSLRTDGDRADLGTQLLERTLYGAAREFLARPSKGLRARLIEVSYALAGGTSDVPRAAADMIELLHSGSLIVDDIQDGADTRRGGPALHHVVGMPSALNTGNWLYFVALTRLDELMIDDARARTLARATHRCLVDCHEGQSLDLALRVPDVAQAQLPSVVSLVTRLKTASPMALAARLGATLAGASNLEIDTLEGFGIGIGMALQMLDDLGSLVAMDRQHKGLEDLRNARVSWVWSWASESVEPDHFSRLTAQLAQPNEFGALREQLATIVEPLGRARVRSALDANERALRERFSSSRALDLVHNELTRLEHSYG